MANPNLDLLKIAAKRLTPLLNELVFVGGCTTGLLITDEAAADVRTTKDVDAIAEITSYVDYMAFSERLRALGFSEDSEQGAPLCRWLHGEIKLDVMPLDEKILGFSNRWYRAAMEEARVYDLDNDLQIRAVTAPFFCATKLEAFRGRGGGDYVLSHDLEDLVTVVDGRPELLEDLKSTREDVHAYIAESVKELLQDSHFLDALPGYLMPDEANQSRIRILLKRLSEIAE
jgi:predicted nucleotidyltransferase